jgi:hypothetical protein
MENNRTDGSGREDRERQQSQGRQGSNSQGYNQNDPNQRESAKFNQDNDDFTRAEDNMDGERNMSSGRSDYSDTDNPSYKSSQRDSEDSWSSETEDRETRNAGTNDRSRSQATNSEEDDMSDDWNRRNL